MLRPRLTLQRSIDRGGDLVATLTQKQKAIELDPSDVRAICGGRQWGKTTWSSVGHVRASLPGVTNLAVAPTITKARDLLFPQFEALNKSHGAGIKMLRGDFRAEFPNGGSLQLLGLSTLAEAEKIRGYVSGFISLEECGTYRDELLRFAVDSCAGPALMRWWRRGGRGLATIGTPSRHVDTFWHDVCRGKTGASVHWATARDNPYMQAEAYFRNVLEQHREQGWTWDTPAFRREYLGEFCADVASLPYGTWTGTVYPQAAAPRDGMTVIALDFGQHHPNSWVVMRLTQETVLDPIHQQLVTMDTIHLLHASKQSGMTTEQVLERTRHLMARFDCTLVVGDGHGQGAQTIKDLNDIYGLGIVPALKRGYKRDRIWMVGGALGSGKLLVYEDTKPWQQEARTLPWNDKLDDHKENRDDHCCDGVLYGYEFLTQTSSAEKPAPIPGSAEWERIEAERRWNERREWAMRN